MHLKLKERELKLTMYDGSELLMRYPTNDSHDSYVEKIIAKPEDESIVTKKFFLGLGMSEEQYDSLQKPDIFDIGMILTGQKKI